MLTGRLLGYQFEISDEEQSAASTRLSHWVKLNNGLTELDEEEVIELLIVEASGRKRQTVMARLYARYNILRSNRERAEILNYALFS